THNTCPLRKLGCRRRRRKHSGIQGDNLPLAIDLHQPTIAMRFLGSFLRLPRQGMDDTLTATAQLLHDAPKVEIMAVRRPDASRTSAIIHLSPADQGLEVGGKAGSRTGATEIGADVVVTTALRNGISNSGHK